MKVRNTFTWVGLAALALMIVLAAAWGQERVLYPAKMPAAAKRSTQAGKLAQPGWHVLEPITYENISVFPVAVRTAADTSAFLTLDEGLASGQVVITEGGGEIIRRSRDGRPIRAPQGAQVNKLVLVNRSTKPLLLLGGELVSGGKQDRVIAKDRIVPVGAEPLPLDVFCVEHGRWSAGNEFKSTNIVVHNSVREKALVDNRQEEVWGAVRSGTTSRPAVAADAAPARISPGTVAETITVEASTQSYDKIYNQSRIGRSVESFAAEVQRRFARATKGMKDERVVGVVVAYGGEVAWADVFASGTLFDGYWPKLLRSYSVEALARMRTQERATLDDAREFLEPLDGRETIESEPGVYQWRQVAEGRYAEIELEALAPKTMTLHWVKIARTS